MSMKQLLLLLLDFVRSLCVLCCTQVNLCLLPPTKKKNISVSSDQVTVVHFSEMMEIKNKKFDINTFFNYISAKNLLPL